MPNGQTASDGSGMSNGLADAWKRVFQKKCVQTDADFVEVNKGNWNWSGCSMPTVDNLTEVLQAPPDLPDARLGA